MCTNDNDYVLPSLTVEDIVSKTNEEEILADNTPYDNVRNNSKIFLIYYAKSQLSRVLKLTNYLSYLEDRIMAQVKESDRLSISTLLRVVNSIQVSISSAVSLIDKVSTNDSYINLVYNDNRNQLIENSNTLISNSGVISKESRDRIREVASKLLNSIDIEYNEGDHV